MKKGITLLRAAYDGCCLHIIVCLHHVSKKFLHSSKVCEVTEPLRTEESHQIPDFKLTEGLELVNEKPENQNTEPLNQLSNKKPEPVNQKSESLNQRSEDELLRTRFKGVMVSDLGKNRMFERLVVIHASLPELNDIPFLPFLPLFSDSKDGSSAHNDVSPALSESTNLQVRAFLSTARFHRSSDKPI